MRSSNGNTFCFQSTKDATLADRIYFSDNSDNETNVNGNYFRSSNHGGGPSSGRKVQHCFC